MATIKLAETEQEFEGIYRFRYNIYVEDMKRNQEYADHSRRIVREPLDEKGANILGIWDNGSVVGTVRYNWASASDLGYYTDLYSMNIVGDYHPKKTSITTKLMILKPSRNLLLAIKLACSLFEIGRKGGIEFDFIDCNDHLIRFFEFLGYRKYKERVFHHEYGEVTPMIMVGSDYEYLEKRRSPFVKLCKQFPPDRRAVDYFYSKVAPHSPA